MFSMICKIWMFILKLLDAIIDGVLHVLSHVIDAVFTIISKVWDGLSSVGSKLSETTFGRVVMYGGLALLGFWLWGLLSDDED